MAVLLVWVYKFEFGLNLQFKIQNHTIQNSSL